MVREQRNFLVNFELCKHYSYAYKICTLDKLIIYFQSNSFLYMIFITVVFLLSEIRIAREVLSGTKALAQVVRRGSSRWF